MHTDQSATKQLIFRNCCRTCRQARLPEDFYAERQSASGYQAFYKDCRNKRVAAWQLARPERHRAHVSPWKASHRHEVRRYDTLTGSRRDQESRDFARLGGRLPAMTGRVLRAEVLLRPESCSDCGRAGVVLDAIHSDYNRPANVCWLRRHCHHRWSLARARTRGDL